MKATLSLHSSGGGLYAWALYINGQPVAGSQRATSKASARCAAVRALLVWLSNREQVAQVLLALAFAFAVVGLCFAEAMIF